MEKLSPNYRQDDQEGLPAATEEYLDIHFLDKLENRDMPHPKILVAFSGGNALGKSTLSEKIGTDLRGLVLENDAIKRLLLEYDPTLDSDARNKLTWQYSMGLYKKLPNITSNGLVVRDGVIDWYYDRILPVFENQGYQLFVIAYDISPEKQLELIHKRGDKTTVSAQRLQTILDDHAIHQKRFRSIYTPDIILNDETVFDHDSVIDALKLRLESM